MDNLPDGCTLDDIDDAAEGRYGDVCDECGYSPCACGVDDEW